MKLWAIILLTTSLLTGECSVWKTFPLDNGCSLIISDDRAKTVYVTEVPLKQYYTIGRPYG